MADPLYVLSYVFFICVFANSLFQSPNRRHGRCDQEPLLRDYCFNDL
jgi:hypothetical protein